ncbi:YjzD family protein [Salimicrobium jeotgali]|uniref:YjzD family protein n=1 Tax=Salimicrobium jeotgali TaxID=1230341 RepID=UPI000C815477|nr:YjzD family protein [Salimicrobium jeotgali]
MRILYTILWSFLFSFMTAYVISNMNQVDFSMLQVILMTAIFTVAVILLGEVGLKEEEA